MRVAVILAFIICPLLGSDPFTHHPCMIYYTLVGVRADRTQTGGDTPARALLPKAPRTALRGRFQDVPTIRAHGRRGGYYPRRSHIAA